MSSLPTFPHTHCGLHGIFSSVKIEVDGAFGIWASSAFWMQAVSNGYPHQYIILIFSLEQI